MQEEYLCLAHSRLLAAAAAVLDHLQVALLLLGKLVLLAAVVVATLRLI